MIYNKVIQSGAKTSLPLFGIKNNINKIFTTSVSFVSGSSTVIVNGVLAILGVDYTETSTSSIEFVSFVPAPSDSLYIEAVFQ